MLAEIAAWLGVPRFWLAEIRFTSWVEVDRRRTISTIPDLTRTRTLPWPCRSGQRRAAFLE
jgi:hypothetical protein